MDSWPADRGTAPSAFPLAGFRQLCYAIANENRERRCDLDAFWRTWLTGFAQGLNRLPNRKRAAVLRACGSACAKPDILPAAQALRGQAAGTDAFFTLFGTQSDAVRTERIVLDRVYDVCYPCCGCPLHTEAGIGGAWLCECSRQSLRWVMQRVFPDRRVSVTLRESVLSGAPQCRLRVRLSRRIGRPGQRRVEEGPYEIA